jgi:hypothetical protein
MSEEVAYNLDALLKRPGLVTHFAPTNNSWNLSILGSMADDQKDDTIFVSFRKVFHIVCQ